MTPSLAEALLRSPLAVSDGGWSTQLWQRDYPHTLPAELANLTHAHLVTALAREYLGAGAQFLSTNTFLASPTAFARRGLREDAIAVCRAGARLAREAIGDGPAVVAGVIGPSGAIMTIGEVSNEQLAADFTAMATALIEGGAGMLVLETFSDLDELLLAIDALRPMGVPLVASLSFDSGAQRTQTLMGHEAAACAGALETAGVAAVGTNCGAGIALALPAVVALRANCKLPIWVKPSAGVPDLEDGRPVYRHTPLEFGGFIPKLIEAGANIIGGCCGVGPEHIRRAASLAESHRRKNSGVG